MLSQRRIWPSLLISGVLVFGAVMAGCSSSGNSPGSTAQPTGSAAESPSAAEPPKPVSMFMGNSGLAHPDGVDPENNKFINIVKELANVELDLEVPSAADFQTRFNLMMASGNLPDIVHTWLLDEAYQYARQGAFIDLKPYYDNSPQLQKYITPEMMEFAKDPVTGNYWRIPMSGLGGPQGGGVQMLRGELIEQYNDGVWPASVDEWVEFFRKVKQAEPDMLILGNAPTGDMAIGGGASVIYYWYGALPYEYRIQNGEVIPNVLLPEYAEATALMRQLYDEGMLDREFATNDGGVYNEKAINGRILMQVNGADQVAPGAAYYRTDPSLPETARSYKWMFAPPLSTYPSVLSDAKFAEPKRGFPIQTHGLFIPSDTKDPETAFKVIEAFASDELYEAIFWGYEGEGVTYNTVDGQRIPTDKFGPGTEDYWSLHLALVFGFTDGQEAKKAAHLNALGEEYHKQVYDSIDAIDALAQKNGIGSLPGYAPEGDAVLQMPDARLDISSFTVEAIMGRITMEEFQNRVAAWEAKYRQTIYGPMQQYLDENKEQLIQNGVLHAGW